jgi:MarR family 2-MHQ and catechol resistance regulon transcriptional repressor
MSAMVDFTLLDGGHLTEKSARELAERMASRTGGDSLSHEAHLVFTRAYTTLTATVRRNNPSQLSLGRFNVLRLLYYARDQRLFMSEIGDGLEVSPTVVTRLVDSLVDSGLAERIEDPTNKRKTWAALTPAGAKLFEAELPPFLELVENMWQGVPDEEKRLLVHLLTKLRLNLLTLESLGGIDASATPEHPAG